MLFGVATDIGRVRKVNEDNFFIGTDENFPYIVVADGMGGHRAGEVASRMAIEVIDTELTKNLNTDLDYVEVGEVIRQAFISANSAIYTYSKANFKVMGMGTTLTLAMVYQNKIIIAHVGDSRVYALSNKAIKQITKDHSYVQELVQRGEITKEQAKNHPQKNYITRAMGVEDIIKVDIIIKPYNGEKLVACSDGLTNMLDDDEIFDIINGATDSQTAAETLVEKANEAGGYDNITVAVMERN